VGGLLPIPITAVSVVLFLYRQRDVMRTPQPEEFRGLHPRRAAPRHSIFGSKLPKFGLKLFSWAT